MSRSRRRAREARRRTARVVRTFSREFLEGMDHDVRSVSLGDRDENDPPAVAMGKRGEPMHVLLMVYAETQPILDRELAAERARFEGADLLHAKDDDDARREQGAFRLADGISMPKIEGVPHERSLAHRGKTEKNESWTNPLPAGSSSSALQERLSGVHQCQMSSSTTIRGTTCPASPASNAQVSLGKQRHVPGVREMTQKVSAFWSYLAMESRPGADPCARAIALGAKLVGRWPSGAPLISRRQGRQQGGDNEFLYARHRRPRLPARRAHPPREPARRPRARGSRHSASIAMVRSASDDPPRPRVRSPGRRDDGSARALRRPRRTARRPRAALHLPRRRHQPPVRVRAAQLDPLGELRLALQGRRPIAAARRPAGHRNPNDEHTVAAEPLRRKYKRLPRFTQLVGGGYFFLPGIAALKFIARLP